MRIVLNHVTRMTAPRICVAGIDEQSGRHVRPTTAASAPITRAQLVSNGGAFELGALVDLGRVVPSASAPEVEDHRCSIAAARHVGRLGRDDYLSLLDGVAEDELEAVFGSDLERRKWGYAVDPGCGTASLGVLRVRRRPDLTIDDRFGKSRLRLRLNDPEVPAFLSVTDVRLVEDDHRTIRRDVVKDVRSRIRRGVDVLLMVGLARAFRAEGDDHERHWLQVNGICLADRPLGEAP